MQPVVVSPRNGPEDRNAKDQHIVLQPLLLIFFFISALRLNFKDSFAVVDDL